MEINRSKQHISVAIKNKMNENNLSLRKLAEGIEGLSYTQIHRITNENNYNIDTLLKVLGSLGLEIEIKNRQ